jgi:CelD/BcsL family acetyltransferase involved in cellulose biosynthesis
MQHRPAAQPLRFSLEPGLSPALDEAADAADPRHAFLRRAWYQGAGGEGLTTLVARRGDGQVIAALPSAKAGRLPIRTVPGSYWPFRTFPIAADATDPELLALLAEARRALGPCWRLGPVNDDDPTAARLIALAPLAGWAVLSRRIATAFLLDIAAARQEGSWPRSSTLKKNRWHEKQLAEHGPLEWRMISGSDWSDAIWDDLATIERRAWVGQTSGTNSKFLDPRQRRIWQEAAQDPALARMISAGLLYIGGEPAAFSFGIDAGPVRYCIATSYDERFAKHSPGKVLTYRTVLDAIGRGITILDDGAGDGGHKSVMGSAPGPEIVDLLFVRGKALGALIAPLWRRTGHLA